MVNLCLDVFLKIIAGICNAYYLHQRDLTEINERVVHDETGEKRLFVAEKDETDRNKNAEKNFSNVESDIAFHLKFGNSQRLKLRIF